MIAKNCIPSEMEQALERVNQKYDNNICWKRFDVKPTSIHFTLTVNDSSKPGHRVGFIRASKGNRRKLAAACWHVHGDFFNALLDINCKSVVSTMGSKIYRYMGQTVGNWQDWQIGSQFDPLMFSEACDC